MPTLGWCGRCRWGRRAALAGWGWWGSGGARGGAVWDADRGVVGRMWGAPPRGTGRLRLMRIGEGEALVALHPCGGTHVARTGEMGPISVVKIEKKGRQNRRIIIAPAG